MPYDSNSLASRQHDIHDVNKQGGGVWVQYLKAGFTLNDHALNVWLMLIFPLLEPDQK